MRTEGGVPRGRGGRHGAGELPFIRVSDGNSEWDPWRVETRSQWEAKGAEVPLRPPPPPLLPGQETTADRRSQRLSTGYSNHELDGGQNSLILCPNTHTQAHTKILIGISAARFNVSRRGEGGEKERKRRGVL